MKALDVEEGGLKLHVDELKLNGCILSPGGGLLLGFMLNSSVSLIVAIERGERTTEPGVMLGSSSMDFSWFPLK